MLILQLTAQDEVAIIEALLDNPPLFLHELQHAIYLTSGTSVCTATICNFLRKQDFSRHKLTFTAQQRNEELRSLFLSEISILDPCVFVFVEETGSDKRLALCRYGYSLKGTRAIAGRTLIRGRFSAIAAICVELLMYKSQLIV